MADDTTLGPPGQRRARAEDNPTGERVFTPVVAPALANAANPTRAEDEPTPLSVDLEGRLRTVTSGASGGTSAVDDSTFAVGSDSLTPAGGLYQSAADLVDDGDTGVFRMTQRRALYMTMETPLGDSMVDDVNDALQVNVVAGGAGGGVAETQVRDSGDTAWENVGPNTANAKVPTRIFDSAGNPAAVLNAAPTTQYGLVTRNIPSGTQLTDMVDEPTRDLGKVDVASLDQYTPVSGRLPVDGSGVTQPISAATLPLPTGAATEATLAAQSAKLPATLGQKAMAASMAVVIASDQSAVAISAASLPLPASAAQEHATAASPHSVRLSTGAAFYDAPTGAQLPAALVGARLDVNAGAWLGSTTPTVGQKALAASIPVAIASDQNSLEVEGDAAHDAAVAGNPVLMGARANANEPTAVDADADAVSLWADRLGRLITVEGHPAPESPVSVSVSAANAQVIATPGASLSLYIKRVLVTNRAAAENVVSLKEGSGGTIRTTLNCAADGGGAVIDYGSVGWKIAANTSLNADAGSASVDVNVLEYYIAA